MVTLYFVRHGRTVYNEENRVQGWCDSPLTIIGEKQAEAVGDFLKHVNFTAALAGDLGRQIHTAKIILERNKSSNIPEVQVMSGLRETYFGSYEQKEIAALKEAVFDELKLKEGSFEKVFQVVNERELTDIVATLDPQGKAETAAVACERITTVVNSVVREVENKGGGALLIVSSGAILKIFLNNFGKVPILDNCSVTIVQYESEVFRIQEYCSPARC